jgi:hypothetical protein
MTNNHPNAQKIACPLNGRAIGLVDHESLYYFCKDNRCKKWHKYPVSEVVALYLAQGGDRASLIEQLTPKEIITS